MPLLRKPCIARLALLWHCASSSRKYYSFARFFIELNGSKYNALSFRAQSRNLTVKLGRRPFVRRCRSEISPRAQLTASLGRNDKRETRRNEFACIACGICLRANTTVLRDFLLNCMGRNITPCHFERSRLIASLGRNDKRGTLVEMTKGEHGEMNSPALPAAFIYAQILQFCAIFIELNGSKYNALPFRAQPRNLTVKLGRRPFVRRCRFGRNDKRGTRRNEFACIACGIYLRANTTVLRDFLLN